MLAPLAFLLLSASPSAVQSGPLSVVILPSSCSDPVGTSLVYKVRDTLARSPLFVLETSRDVPSLRIYITCHVPRAENTGHEVNLAIATTLWNGQSDLFLGVDAATCGALAVDRTAEQIVASLDDRSRNYRSPK